ncbi:hypothetical protein N0V90_004066 [Kalmusia sp. IMI 367209]|nr:hypothetical protein N0V90_004066 [Kalmusia sp. IMI 367209]
MRDGNGSTAHGNAAADSHLIKERKPSTPKETSDEDVQLVLQSFRLLIADLCQQFGMGHPGGAIGMAAFGVALWKYTMRYAPHTPYWFNRDKFTLSNGHTCLFQYVNLYLSGHKAMTWEQLLSYHSESPDSLCPGHPEIDHKGIELTTGPLGQGISNAVGLAIATKHLAATFNRPGYEVVNNHTWCSIGDACLQETVSCEALSYAGHLKLGNLTVIYDNNQITCDGSVDLTNTEDVNKKMKACGWEVIEVEDGVNDVESINAALQKGRDPKRTKPLFINVRSIIGVGSTVAGKAVSHGAPLGKENVAAMEKAYGWDPEKVFHIPDKVTKFYEDIPARSENHVKEWNDLLAAYTNQYPDLAQTFKDRMAGEFPPNWESTIPTSFPSNPTPSRKSNNLVVGKIFASCPTFMVGTADLTPSVNMTWPDYEIFNPPDLKPISGKQGSYKGRYIHYGIREHVMAAIANGLAAYSPRTIIPITSTFFMFYLYAAPAVHMGEDGPTHQPVELAALYRAMPNMEYIRPGDSEEVAGAWKRAIEYEGGPTMISITLVSAGAELGLPVDVVKELADKYDVKARVVSFPCHKLFREQPIKYQREVLR